MAEKQVDSINAGIEPEKVTPRAEATRDADISEYAVFPSSELNAIMEYVVQEIPALPNVLDSGILDLENLEATAAGLGAGSGGDGNSFVRLDRILEPVTPLAYQYNTYPQPQYETQTTESISTTQSEVYQTNTQPAGVSSNTTEVPTTDPVGESGDDKAPSDKTEDSKDAEPTEAKNSDQQAETSNESKDAVDETQKHEDDSEQTSDQPQDTTTTPHDTNDDKSGSGTQIPTDAEDTKTNQKPTPPTTTGEEDNDKETEVDDDSSDSSNPGGSSDHTNDTTGSNPGNDKTVGNSKWDGETGASGKPGNGKTQDGVDTDTNQPGGNEKGQNVLNPADVLDDSHEPHKTSDTPDLTVLLLELNTKQQQHLD